MGKGTSLKMRVDWLDLPPAARGQDRLNAAIGRAVCCRTKTQFCGRLTVTVLLGKVGPDGWVIPESISATAAGKLATTLDAVSGISDVKAV